MPDNYLSGIMFFGWPLSFYMAAQGMVLIYVAIVGCYEFKMRKLDASSQEEASNVD